MTEAEKNISGFRPDHWPVGSITVPSRNGRLLLMTPRITVETMVSQFVAKERARTRTRVVDDTAQRSSVDLTHEKRARWDLAVQAQLHVGCEIERLDRCHVAKHLENTSGRRQRRRREAKAP